MSVTLQRETIETVRPDIEPLLVKHWKEIGWNKQRMPLNPMWGMYQLAEDKGMLKIYTARQDGALVGYAIFLLGQNMHYSVLEAKNDIFYVDQSRRGAMVGHRLMMELAEPDLRKCGVQVLGMHIKIAHDWMPLAKHWGYEHTEHTLHKWIGD